MLFAHAVAGVALAAIVITIGMGLAERRHRR